MYGTITWQAGNTIIGEEVQNWNWSAQVDTVDVSYMETATSAHWKVFLPGSNGWTGSCETVIDSGDLANILSAQGATGAVQFITSGTNGWEGTAICTVAVDQDKDDAVRVTYDLQGTGALSNIS